MCPVFDHGILCRMFMYQLLQGAWVFLQLQQALDQSRFLSCNKLFPLSYRPALELTTLQKQSLS